MHKTAHSVECAVFESVKILLRSILTETSPLTRWIESYFVLTDETLRGVFFVSIGFCKNHLFQLLRRNTQRKSTPFDKADFSDRDPFPQLQNMKRLLKLAAFQKGFWNKTNSKIISDQGQYLVCCGSFHAGSKGNPPF